MNKSRGPFKAILSTRQGDLIDYTHARSFDAARDWLGVIGSNAVGLILDRDGFPVWESSKLDADGNVIRNNPDSIHIDIHSHNTKGRNVRAKNPVTEARELWLYARNRWPIVNEARAAFQSNASAAKWKSIALKAARDYSAEFGNGASRWRDIFTDDDLSVTASMLRDDMQNEAEDDAQYADNPTPRLTRYDQPSQRERINPRTGRPTKAPSKRLKERRLKTHHFAPEGVWANPLTRVKLKSPAQRSGEVPEKGSRLYKRRQTTAKAPAGFYANPAARFLYAVWRVDSRGEPAYFMRAFRTMKEAKEYAQSLANNEGITYGIQKKPL